VVGLGAEGVGAVNFRQAVALVIMISFAQHSYETMERYDALPFLPWFAVRALNSIITIGVMWIMWRLIAGKDQTTTHEERSE
jgi:hypothetical protein